MSHTPTPWSIESDDLVTVYAEDDCDVHPVASTECNHTCRMLDEQHANAAYIVKCVNERDDLVHALEEALEFITGQEDVVDGDYGEPKPNAAMQMCNRIREVLGQRPGP